MSAPNPISENPQNGLDNDSQWREDRSGDDIDREIEPLHFQPKEHRRPKRHRHSLFLLIVYIPLITIPWILVCILAKRPLGASSYYNQHGFLKSDITKINSWVTAINVINSISSLITIPVLSALIAQAAVVYVHSHKTRPSFHIDHLVALADRGWTDPFTLGRSWKWRRSNGLRSLLYFALVVILLGSIQQPLYQILIPMETILIPTCGDTYYMQSAIYYNTTRPECEYADTSSRIVGWDLEPKDLVKVSYNDYFQKLMGDLAVASLNDIKSHLWTNISNVKADANADNQKLRNLKNGYFVASLEQGTTTGVLREHLMRLNSTVTCKRIQRSEFPSTCSGEGPFTRDFSHSKNFTRVCVPGSFGVSPWTLSRNRQEITEDLYLDILEELVISPGFVDEHNLTSDYTLHCTATTTRGYFELGNYRNNYTWGPLLDQWPSPDEMKMEFNDYLGLGYPSEQDKTRPFKRSDYITNSGEWYAPGPLTMTAAVLFGNNTFFDTATLAWNDTITDADVDNLLPYYKLCSLVPFARLDPPKSKEEQKFPDCRTSSVPFSDGRDLKVHLSTWLHGFNDTNTATTALSSAVLLANEALLTIGKWNSMYANTADLYGRLIYSGPGASIRKPKISSPAMIILTLILFLELLALGLLAWLIYRGPSETRILDTMAVSRIMASMDEEKRATD